MNRTVTLAFGSFWTLGLLVVALWTWQNAKTIVTMWEPARPDVAAWAIGSLAIGLACTAQVVLVTFVVGVIHRHDWFIRSFRLLSAAGLTAALVSAAALGLAGR